MNSARQVQQALHKISTSKKAAASAWFFKTGPGQYGYGDRFRGVTVPEQRVIARRYKNLALSELVKLLQSPWHEDRLTALFILVYQFQHGDKALQTKIQRLYIKNTHRINNWDLVDSSAAYLTPPDLTLLKRLAKSKLLWERRIAIIATLASIRQGNSKPTFTIAKILLHDREDLMHKAVGWMLREVGKNCGQDVEEQFLRQHYKTMPRTMLRYAIEHFSPARKRFYMQK